MTLPWLVRPSLILIYVLYIIELILYLNIDEILHRSRTRKTRLIEFYSANTETQQSVD